MPKSKIDKATDTILARPSLSEVSTLTPNILKEGGPTRPPLGVQVEVTPSILKEGGPTRPPLEGKDT